MEELKQEQMHEQEKSVEEKQATTSEEKPVKTYTQEEVEQIKKNAIAEGMRKASKQQATQNNEELEKLNASLSEKDSLIAEREKQLEESQKELTAIKQVKKMDDLGIDRKYQEDVIALIKGHGDEVNEETISLIAENHPEWKVDAEIGIGQLGQTRPQSNPYDEAQVKEQQEIKEKFRL